MEYFTQQFINGIVIGMQYALFAVGLVLIFGILRLINFAHGAMYAWGGVLAVLAVELVGSQAIAVSVLAGLLGGGIMGAFVQFGIMAPLQKKGVTDHMPQAVATIGISVAFVGLASAVLGPNPRSFPSGSFAFKLLNIAGIQLAPMHLITIFVAVAALIILDIVMFRTRLGRQIRTVAFAPETGSLLGINVDRMRTWSLVFSAALAGLAGALAALSLDLASPYLSEGILTKGFAIIVLGGMGSVRGAIAGGVLLGVVEALVSSYGLNAYRDVFGVGLLFIVLMVRPQGLFGQAEVERA